MSNYNKMPYFPIPGKLFSTWTTIREELTERIKTSQSDRYLLVVECYQGVDHNELTTGFKQLNPTLFIHSSEAFYSEEKIKELTFPDVTDDAIFGYMTRLSYTDFLDPDKVALIRKKIQESTGLVIVYGHAAAVIAEECDCLVYADMARWEIQLRQRKHEVCNLGIENSDEVAGIQYKRGFFVDWSATG